MTIANVTFDFFEQRRVEGDAMPQIFFKKVMVVQERGNFEVSDFHFPRRYAPYGTWFINCNTVKIDVTITNNILYGY